MIKVSPTTIQTVLSVKQRMANGTYLGSLTTKEFNAVKRLYKAVRKDGLPIPAEMQAIAKNMGLA